MKEKIKIAITDFRETAGKVMYNHYLFKIFNQKYDLELSDSPDILFFSTFGGKHRKYDCIKVLYTDENKELPSENKERFWEYDFSFSFDETDDKNFQLPFSLKDSKTKLLVEDSIIERFDMIVSSIGTSNAVPNELYEPFVCFNRQTIRKQIVNELISTIDFNAIVETGTWRGNTTGYLHEISGLPVHTCELDRRYYLIAKKKLANFKGIHNKLSDSRKFLKKLAENSVLSKQTIFFYLDAHWNEDLPLREEIELICSHWKNFVVMIDDFKVPGDSGYGYDNYGKNGILQLEFINDLVEKHNLIPLFPSTSSTQETGAKRGCVVLIRENMKHILHRLTLLALHTNKNPKPTQSGQDLAQKLFEIFKDDIANTRISDATERVKILVILSAVAWNYTITKDDNSLKNLIEHSKNSFDSSVLEELLTKFIGRKLELFPNDKRLIAKCHISQRDNGEFSLTVDANLNVSALKSDTSMQRLDLNKVKILKQNSVYRVADVVLRRGIRWEQDRKTILSDSKYKDSILYDYLIQKNEEPDFDTLKKIVWQHIREKKYQTAYKNDLVVHMRLGDVTEYPDRADCLTAYTNFYQKVDLDGLPISKVVIVTALHFGANELNNLFFYSDTAKEKSFAILRDFERQTNEVGLPLEIISNENIDSDIAFMASSKHFVKGRTQLSDLISKCLRTGSKLFTLDNGEVQL